MSPRKLNNREFKKTFKPFAPKGKNQTKANSSNPVMKQFDEHAFFKNLVTHAINPLLEEYRKATRENKEVLLNDELKYHFYVFEYAGSFYEALKRLYVIPLFTQRGFSLRWMNNLKIAPQEWVIYNYANYRVIATGIYDTILLIVNDVLEIGEKPKDVNRKFINKTEIIKNNLFEPLQKIDTLMAIYREERNQYVHRSTRPDIDFVDNLYAYQVLRQAKEQGLYDKEIPTPKTAQEYYETELNKKVNIMQKETEDIFSVIIAFLDVLNPLYEKKIEHYKIKSTGDII